MKILGSRWDRGLTLDVESLCSHLILSAMMTIICYMYENI